MRITLSHFGLGRVPSPPPPIHVLARKERANEGFRWSIGHLPCPSQRSNDYFNTTVPPRPSSTVAPDICLHSGRALLVVDYCSKCIEVDFRSSEASGSVIRSLMVTFSRFGMPHTLVTDNGICLASSKFVKFVD